MTATSPAAEMPVRVQDEPWLERLLGLAERTCLNAASLCLVLMLALNAANLIARNVTGKGIGWVWPWTAVLFIWSVFFAFFVLYRRKLDVNVDLVVSRVPRGARRALGALTCLCGLLFSGLILLQAPEIIKRQVGVMDFVGLDRYWLSLPLIWSSLFVFIQFAAWLTAPEKSVERDPEEEVQTWSL